MEAGMEISAAKELAGELILIQLLAFSMNLIGLGELHFCTHCADHKKDRWPLAIAFLVLVFFTIIFVVHFDIPALLAMHDNTGEACNKCGAVGLLKALAWTDSLVLLAVVLLTGGLARSFYAPVFVVIPAVALLLQKNPEYTFTGLLCLTIVIFITISALASAFNIDTWLKNKWAFNPTTQHNGYYFSLWAVTVLSAAMIFADFLFWHKK
jgi:hypothetical protein